MKRIKKIAFILLFICVYWSIHVNAETVITQGTIEDLSSYMCEGIEFYLPTSSYVVLNMDVSIDYGRTKNDSFRLLLKGYDDDACDYNHVYEDDTFRIADGLSGEINTFYDYSRLKLPKGQYRYEFQSSSESNGIDIEYRVTAYSTYTTSLTLDTNSVAITAGNWTKIRYALNPFDSFLVFSRIASSNPSIADVDYDENYIYIEGYKQGNAVISGGLYNGRSFQINVQVKNPKKPKLQYNKYTMYSGESFQNTVFGKNSKVSWTSSNKKIATVNKKGKVVAKKPGKCTITAKIGKVKLKCAVTVKRQDPNFFAELYEYNTRNNYFTVRFKNNAKIPLIIKSGIKVENVDYKTFDRKVRLKKTVTIKPGKYAYVKFYVRGRHTWPDYSDYTLFYKFQFDGGTYEGHVWDEDSSYKEGKKWYTTYWTSYEDELNEW